MSAFLQEVAAEVARARAKYPIPDGNMTALTHEVGELAKAVMTEPHDRVYRGAVQVAVMAQRLAEEGDPTLDGMRKWRVKL